MQNVALHQIYLGCYAKSPLLGKHSFGCCFTPNQKRDLKLDLFGSVSGVECGFTQNLPWVLYKKLLLGEHSFGSHFTLVAMQHCFGYCFTWNQLRDLKSGLFGSVSGAECGFAPNLPWLLCKESVTGETFFWLLFHFKSTWRLEIRLILIWCRHKRQRGGVDFTLHLPWHGFCIVVDRSQ